MTLLSIRGGARRTLLLAILVACGVLALVLAATPSRADDSNHHNMEKTTYFSGSPKVGAIKCQHKTISLRKVSSGYRWAWSENYPQESSGYLANFNQTFHGSYYWTVCVSSMKGKSIRWKWVEYSMLTRRDSACENRGHCTTYTLQYHYLDETGEKQLWGSQLFVVPAHFCSHNNGECATRGSVSVERS